MAHVVQLGTGARHRLIFELRYECGELYWDRCGRIARTLAHVKGWAVQSVDVNGCHIRNEDLNLVFTYSPAKLDLTQSQSKDVSNLLSHGEFAAIAEEFSETVVRALEVDTFPRIGFRVWTLYETQSVEDATQRIGKMSFFRPCKELIGLGEPSHLSFGVVVDRPRQKIRIAVTPFEQQIHLAPSVIAAARAEARKHWKEQRSVRIQKMKAQKAIKAYPSVGLMIDLDSYIEEVPYPDELSVGTFVEEAAKDFDLICETILAEAEGER